MERRTFYSKYFLCAIFFGVAVFLVMKFVVGVSDDYFVLSERKSRILVYFARVVVLNFSLFGFLRDAWCDIFLR